MSYEIQGLDLDTGSVVSDPDPFEADPGADVVIAYDAEQVPHALLQGNRVSGVRIEMLQRRWSPSRCRGTGGGSCFRVRRQRWQVGGRVFVEDGPLIWIFE